MDVIKRIYIGYAGSYWQHDPQLIAAAFGREYELSLRSPDSELGAHLLLEMLRQLGVRTGRRTEIRRTQNGRPYFPHLRGISFSISHSKGAAVCAVAFGTNVGADLEVGFPEPSTAARLAARWLEPRGFDINGTPFGFAGAWTAFEASSKYTGGTLAECRGIPAGTVCDSYPLNVSGRRGIATVCHMRGVPVIPLGSFTRAVSGRDRAAVLGIGFDILTADEAVRRAADALEGDELLTVVTPNPVISMRCFYDARLFRAVSGASLSLADGRGIIDAAGRLGVPITERIAGIDFGYSLLRRAAEGKKRVFLLGGRPGRADEAAKKLSAALPGLDICGTCDGFEGSENDDKLRALLAAAHPDILFVCLGSPRQECWIDDNREFLERVGVRVAAALGGSLDVWSGDVRRAPEPFIRLRLEWLWRCIREPRRLRVIPTLVRYRILTRKHR